MISAIKTAWAIAYALTLLGGGIYVGWHSNTLYSQATTDPLGLAYKLAIGGK